MDPAQQKMMAFTMPAVFGFMMWNYGSGLALYWACSNLIRVGQQVVMNRTGMGKRDARDRRSNEPRKEETASRLTPENKRTRPSVKERLEFSGRFSLVPRECR